MPFYEYQCNNCGHALEAMQKVSDPPLKKCPHCGKRLKAPDSAAGKRAKCPGCGKPVQLPKEQVYEAEEVVDSNSGDDEFGLQGQEGRGHIGGGSRVGQVAAQGGQVADLERADDARPLRQRPEAVVGQVGQFDRVRRYACADSQLPVCCFF